jgi:hypothetical protein
MKIIPEGFKPHQSDLDQFVSELPIEVVQKVIVEVSELLSGNQMDCELTDELATKYLGKPQTQGGSLYGAMRDACCRRLAYALMGMSVAPIEPNETWYRGVAQDGSFWRIPRSAVIKDMEEFEKAEGTQEWPRPISDTVIEDWLFDNADTTEGWELDCITPPENTAIQVMRGAQIRPSGGTTSKTSEADFHDKLERDIANAVPLGESRTVRDLAGELKVSQKAIIEAVEGGMEGFDMIVAMGVRGATNGYRNLPKGDQLVEHYQ